MPDRQKVVRGLECCIRKLEGQRVCDECPYDENFNCLGCDGVLRQAIAMLREQEPRVMTLEEIRMHEVYWAEQENVSRPWPIAMHHIRAAGLLDGPVYQDYMGDNYNIKEYGETWRCWTARPTDEQREAVKWDAAD